MNAEIKNRFTGAVIVPAGKYESLKHAVEEEKAYLRGANLDGANLDGAYLRGANLDGANLDGANLDGANLRGANLRGANLDGAYLRGANLVGANLAGANLRGADLDGANLDGAYLDGAENYFNSHDFFAEVVKRNFPLFTIEEWAVIGQIVVLRICWDTIIKRHAEHAESIFKKLKDVGFGEFLTKFNEEWS